MSNSADKTPPLQPTLESLAPYLRQSRRPLVNWSFMLFAGIILMNLNGVVAMGARAGQVFTLLLFGLSLVILLVAGVTPKRDLGATGLAYFAFLIAYIAIGSMASSFDSGVIIYVHHLWMLAAGVLTVYVSAAASRRILLTTPPEAFLPWLALLACVPVLMVYVDFLWPGFHDLLPRTYEQRHSGLFLDPNDAGVAVNVATVFCLGCLLTGRWRTPFSLAVAACGVAAILTFSRTAIIVYFALLIGTSLFPRPRGAGPISRRRIVLISGILAVAVFGWFLVWGVQKFGDLGVNEQRRIENITDLAQGQNVDKVLSNRLPVFRLGMKYWLESPLVGWGLGVGTSMEYPGGHIGCHNTWLLVLVDAGLVPAVLFATFAVIWLLHAARCQIASVRIVALGFFIVFWLTTLSLHTTLTKRYLNVGVGIVIGLMAADRELQQRRKSWLREVHRPATGQPVLTQRNESVS